MHPLLTQRRSFWIYLGLWSALGLIPAGIVDQAAPFGREVALLLCVPMTLAFSLVTLPVWYVCRALPLSMQALPRLIPVHLLAAALWGFAFRLGLEIGAQLLALAPAWVSLPEQLSTHDDALLGVGVLFYSLVATFHYLLLALEGRREADRQQAAMTLTARDAELRALRAQVHPHFLFNSLNTVSALVGHDPAGARQACVLLADYLRGTLGAAELTMVPLRQELELSGRYLGVERLRLGERLRVDEHIDDDVLDWPIPSLLLQPLVENAVTHGVVPLDDPGPVSLTARRQGERLVLSIHNSVDPAPRPRPPGLGLANVRARLTAQYRREAELHVDKDSETFTVTLKLPRHAD